MRRIFRSITLAIGLVLTANAASAAVVTQYTSQSAFNAAVPGAITFGFDAGGATNFLPIPSNINGFSFASIFSNNPTPLNPDGGIPMLALVPSTDTPTYGVDFLTFQNTNPGVRAEISSKGISAIGFTYGSYVYASASDATVWVNGIQIATITPSSTPAFLGFTSTSPITSVVVDYPGNPDGSTGGYAFDLTSVSASPALSAAPEPAIWAMMLIGFGLIGTMMRSRRHAVFAS